MTKKTHHIVPNHNGGWDVKKGGAEKASNHFDKKNDAVNIKRQSRE